MQPRDKELLKNDIKRFGFVDPVTVRPVGKRFQIIDGEHRWLAAKEMGIEVPYVDIGPVDDQTAKKLTIALNELRGQFDPSMMGDLLNELLQDESPEELLGQLPFTEEALAGLVGLKGFDWKGLGDEPKGEKKPARWVERTFRMPPDAAEVLDEAIARAREQDGIGSDVQALEMIAADFLAG